jgi:hypothetical protein
MNGRQAYKRRRLFIGSAYGETYRFADIVTQGGGQLANALNHR